MMQTASSVLGSGLGQAVAQGPDQGRISEPGRGLQAGQVTGSRRLGKVDPSWYSKMGQQVWKLTRRI